MIEISITNFFYLKKKTCVTTTIWVINEWKITLFGRKNNRSLEGTLKIV